MKIKELKAIIESVPDNVEIRVVSADPDSDVEFLINQAMFDTVNKIYLIEINL